MRLESAQRGCLFSLTPPLPSLCLRHCRPFRPYPQATHFVFCCPSLFSGILKIEIFQLKYGQLVAGQRTNGGENVEKKKKPKHFWKTERTNSTRRTTKNQILPRRRYFGSQLTFAIRAKLLFVAINGNRYHRWWFRTTRWPAAAAARRHFGSG